MSKTREEITDTLELHMIGCSGLYNSQAVNWKGETAKGCLSKIMKGTSYEI